VGKGTAAVLSGASGYGRERINKVSQWVVV
jgi:hypothetical protein